MIGSLITTPLSWLYGMVIAVRHKLFDWKLLKSKEFDIPIVCVGNITVGGTGKTPVTEFLISHLGRDFNVGVVSRGYKRKTKGFVLATTNSSYLQIGDEPKQIKLKFPNIPVAVCEKRVEGIEKLREAHPEIDLIILDDAFQHRYVEPWVNIVLMDYNRPIYRDHLLPRGRLRDTRKQMNRAQFVVVTKCPKDMTPLDIRIVYKSLNLYPYQSLYFSEMRNGKIIPLFPDMVSQNVAEGDNVIAMSGIANPRPFREHLEQNYNVTSVFEFPDHHPYRVRDMERLKGELAKSPADTVIITTEKDAVKLVNRNKVPVEIQERLFYMPINISFVGNNSQKEFLRQLGLYVRTNQKYSEINPG